jgi:hypothetical protein
MVFLCVADFQVLYSGFIAYSYDTGELPWERLIVANHLPGPISSEWQVYSGR